MSAYALRLIEQPDIEAVVVFSAYAACDFTHDLAFNAEVFGAYLAAFIAKPTNLALMIERDGAVHGYILAFADINIYSGKAQCSKATWVVAKHAAGQGRRLLKEAEKWAVANFGNVTMYVSAPNNSVADLLQRMGYEAKELTMGKQLWQW